MTLWPRIPSHEVQGTQALKEPVARTILAWGRLACGRPNTSGPHHTSQGSQVPTKVWKHPEGCLMVVTVGLWGRERQWRAERLLSFGVTSKARN